MPTPRRFPQSWTIEELNDACFIVSDSNGQKLAYVYFEEEPGRRSAAKLLSKDEARRIAANFARLPELLKSQPQWPDHFRLRPPGRPTRKYLKITFPSPAGNGKPHLRQEILPCCKSQTSIVTI
jgi:hypothetical protein